MSSTEGVQLDAGSPTPQGDHGFLSNLPKVVE